LNKDENTTLEVLATYPDNSTKVLSNVEWIVTPKESVEVNGATLTAKKNNATTLKAKVGNTLSNAVNLNITWTVNGHTLPPEPDKALNDSTLLGIDSNDNGVRDDVERWIYTKYKEYTECHKQAEGKYTLPDGTVVPVYNVNSKEICSKPIPYHPVVRAVAMQGARAAQIIIQEPKKARETTVYEDNAQYCEFYLNRISKENNDSSIGAQDFIIKEFNKAQYNTVQRARAYGKYNFHLSGGVYRLPKSKDMINGCDDNIKNIIKGLK